MFERYTEKARRVIFFARYEASQFGQPFIETEHLLLGLLREDKALTNRFLRTDASVESIRRQIEKNVTIREKISTSVGLPLSDECKRVLAYAAEEAERLGHKHIGTEHLLLGLLREDTNFACRILNERGIELEKLREELARIPVEQPQGRLREAARLASLYTDLTQKAADGELQPVVARDVELQSMMEVLCRKERRNPMLIGEPGAGKRAIVEALAQRIAEGSVPASLAQMRVLAVSAEVLAAWDKGQPKFEEIANQLSAVADTANLILFVSGLPGLSGKETNPDGKELAGALNFVLQQAEIRIISSATAGDFQAACATHPEVEKRFVPLHVRPLDEVASRQVLRARKDGLEKFHEVAFADEALACAIERADSYRKDKLLPGKALELLDAAAASVKVHEQAEPAEVAEVKKKLAFIAHRMASSIANHEFEKARFYSDEERKERENLAALQQRHGLDAISAPTVSREDVEKIIAKWNAYPYSE